LQAAPGGERCPKCGLPTVVSSESASAGAVLEHDTRCRRCGYNLRGLARGGLCPECAAPIEVSARADFLCFAEPHYVARLARGIRWINRSLPTALIAILLAALGMLLEQISPGTTLLDVFLIGLWSFTFLVLFFVAVVFFPAGVWLLTSGEPGVSMGWRRDRARKLVRVYLLVGALAIALDLGLQMPMVPLPIVVAGMLLSIGASVFGVIGLAAYFHYVSDIAGRLPDRALAVRSRGLAWNVALIAGVLVLIGAGEQLVAWAPVVLSKPSMSLATTAPAYAMRASGVFHVFDTCLGGIARIVALILFFRALRLHRHLRQPLEQQAALAEKHWQSQPCPPSAG
jgi:hypothetical protein